MCLATLIRHWLGQAPLIPQPFRPALHEDRAGSGSQSERVGKEGAGSWQLGRHTLQGEGWGCAPAPAAAQSASERISGSEGRHAFKHIRYCQTALYPVVPIYTPPQQPRGVLISLPELGIERLLCLGHFGGCVMFQICNSWITNHCQCLYVFLGNLHFFREVPVCLFFALGYLTFSSWSPRAYTLCVWQTSRLSFNSPLFFLLLSYSRLLIHGSSEC